MINERFWRFREARVHGEVQRVWMDPRGGLWSMAAVTAAKGLPFGWAELSVNPQGEVLDVRIDTHQARSQAFSLTERLRSEDVPAQIRLEDVKQEGAPL